MANPAAANPLHGQKWEGGSYQLGGDGVPSKKVELPIARPVDPKKVSDVEPKDSILRIVLSCLPLIGAGLQIYNYSQINNRCTLLKREAPNNPEALKAALEHKNRYNKYALISHIATITFFVALAVLSGVSFGLILGMILFGTLAVFTFLNMKNTKEDIQSLTQSLSRL